MCHKNIVKKWLLIVSILLLGLFNQPTQVHASGNLILNGGDHRDRHEEGRNGRYTEVVVGNDRYYYDTGVFYRGDPGNYVPVEAPVGAVVYEVPSGYERVDIDGVSYVRYGSVYYRPVGHGYRVERIEKSRELRDNHAQGSDKRDEHRDEHHGE